MAKSGPRVASGPKGGLRSFAAGCAKVCCADKLIFQGNVEISNNQFGLPDDLSVALFAIAQVQRLRQLAFERPAYAKGLLQ